MKRPWFLVPIVIVILLAITTTFALGAGPKATPILPDVFSGWRLSGSPQISPDPNVADPTNAPVLKEYGFTDATFATYNRGDGPKLTIKAARFQDASGAYGAFTFYKTPQMQTEKIGDQAASFNERILFYRGNLLIDAQFERLSAMSAAELRDLASNLPLPPTNSAKLPGLPAYLPLEGYIKNTAKYVVGPAALEKVDPPVNSQLVDFSAGAEVVLGNYKTSDGVARLMLIAYPTPQIALSHLRSIDASHQQPANIFDKRTGPIVAVVAGAESEHEAKSLLAAVNYEADITWNENTTFDRRNDPANFIVNIIYLCAIIGGFAIISGIAFGGIRLLSKRYFPDRFFDNPEMGLISLHLSGNSPEASQGNVNPSIKAS